jgi:hypothetical protein
MLIGTRSIFRQKKTRNENIVALSLQVKGTFLRTNIMLEKRGIFKHKKTKWERISDDFVKVQFFYTICISIDVNVLFFLRKD